MSAVTWFAFGLALADALVLCLLAAAGYVVFRKAGPLLATFGLMGGMLGAAAGTGGAEESADSSPAAVVTVPLDPCEYEDHDWSPPECPRDTPSRHCRRCGYAEPLPGR